MRIITGLLIFIAASLTQVYAANITARLDVNPVLVTDSFQLTYTLTGNVDGVPDFSPIKKDFTILRNQQSSNISMINGDFKQTKTWTLTLISKQTGIFVIPQIAFGADQAPEVKVVVKDIPTSTSSTPAQDFIVEMDVSDKTAYSQQQIIITARLLVSKNISSYQFGELSTSNPDALVIPLTKDKQYKTYKGNKQFIAVEKKFALFAPEAGELTINPFLAEIGITTRSSRGGFFDPFNNNTRTKRISSKAQRLTIKSPPKNFNGKQWLPAQSIKLSEQWPTNSTFVAGEPITRTITLTAEGLTSSQLENIKQATTSGLKQYPDKPTAKESKTEFGIKSTKTQKVAFIPTGAGNYSLPAMQLKWWNTKTNKMETAYIGKREFTVKAAPQNALTPAPSNNQVINNLANNTLTANENKTESASTVTIQTEQTSSAWFWASMLFLMLWLSTTFLWWKAKQNRYTQQDKTEDNSLSLAKNLKQLKKACDKNNPQEIKSALINWANSLFPDSPIYNLSDLAKQLDESLATKINQLNSHLYAANDSSWSSDDIYQLCQKYKPASSKNKNSHSAALEPLNKR